MCYVRQVYQAFVKKKCQSLLEWEKVTFFPEMFPMNV